MPLQRRHTARTIGQRWNHLAQDLAARFQSKSESVINFVTLRMNWIAYAWLCFAGGAAILRLSGLAAASTSVTDIFAAFLLDIMLIFAPLAGFWAAAGSFPLRQKTPQPSFRLATYGRWRNIDNLEACRAPHYGPTGFLASLIIGLMLNIPLRFLSFIVAVPAIGSHAPHWAGMIFWALAVDVGIMSFLYASCFVMALRSIPLFPRMLAYVWSIDILTQLCIGKFLGSAHNVPVEVAGAMQALLSGQIDRVLISIFVWLPYLLISTRVNLTYRNRIRLARPTSL